MDDLALSRGIVKLESAVLGAACTVESGQVPSEEILSSMHSNINSQVATPLAHVLPLARNYSNDLSCCHLAKCVQDSHIGKWLGAVQEFTTTLIPAVIPLLWKPLVHVARNLSLPWCPVQLILDPELHQQFNKQPTPADAISLPQPPQVLGTSLPFEHWPAPPANASSQVGGHLTSFSGQWSALGASSAVMCSVEGLQLEFSCFPPLQHAARACDCSRC